MTYEDMEFIMEYETYDMLHQDDYDDAANGYVTQQQARGDGSPLETKVRHAMLSAGILFIPQWEYVVNGCQKFADFCINIGRKLVIEIFGDETHCNPKQYSDAYYRNQYGKYACNVWAYDAMKIRYLESTQYPVLVLWGHEINKDLAECISRIMHAITSFTRTSFSYSCFVSLNIPLPARMPSAEELASIPHASWRNHTN